jgi:hypothetical protein
MGRGGASTVWAFDMTRRDGDFVWNRGRRLRRFVPPIGIGLDLRGCVSSGFMAPPHSLVSKTLLDQYEKNDRFWWAK